MKQTPVLIIGASLSGLACAAALRKDGIGYIMIEKEAQMATPWRNHYERLHLHTSKSLSHLPYKKFDRSIPAYPSRQQVLAYVEDYAREHNIDACFNTEAKKSYKQDSDWITETTNGVFQSNHVIIATGVYNKPKVPSFKGLESFPGTIVHSAHYKTGKDFRGQKILVVGFGNSACEIAIDLYEQGAIPAMSVRSPVNLIPRDLLGISIQRFSLLLSKLPPRVADTLIAPIMRVRFGDTKALGLQKMKYGVFEQIQKDNTIPLLDIGTVQHIRQKHIAVCNDIDSIDGKTVRFIDGKQEEFDAIIAAIGYECGFTDLVQIDKSRRDELQLSINKQKYFGKNGLYFCGFRITATGHIREISIEAQKIATDIAGKEQFVLMS